MKKDGLIQEEPSGEAALAGTLAHKIAELMILKPGSTFQDTLKALGETDEDVQIYYNKLLSLEQGVAEYVSVVLETAKGAELKTEHRFSFGNDLLGGSCDAMIIDKAKNTLHIFDLKTGRVLVIAEENKQLLLYAAFGLSYVKALNSDMKVCLHIGQPTKFPFMSTFETDAKQVKRFIEKEVSVALDKRNDPTAFGPGGQCKYCPAKTFCPSFFDYAKTLSRQNLFALGDPKSKKEIQMKIATMIDTASPMELRDMFNQLQLCAEAFSQMKVTVAEAINQADGDKLEQFLKAFKVIEGKRSYRAWKDASADDLQETLTQELGAGAVQALSPSQIEKVFGDKGAAVVAAIFENCGETKGTSYTILKTIK